ncbi:ABC transporter permease [Lapidilactobacillus bayanensis]|uniref:ABC transporter permease n=1 Tax=Lapidilactobacillus bayanensis TaxID=2485998 RepID=UPI000F79697A|nr:ABC transporter permease [Lapidilactobacillus bayanensis]
MNVITRLNLRSFRTEKKRTIATILAMAIAATMAVAILVGFRSVQLTIYNRERQATGGVIAFNQITARQKDKLLASGHFASTASLKEMKPVKLVDKKRLPTALKTPNHFEITELTSKNLNKLVAPLLESGHLPKTQQEILIPNDLSSEQNRSGQKLTVLAAGQKKDYQIVGTYNAYLPGFVPTGLITYDQQQVATSETLIVTPKNLTAIRAQAQQLASNNQISAKQLSFNENALLMLGQSTNAHQRVELYSTILICLVIVGIAALILIFTSINLSVRARRQRYGLLRSIGMTPKQLRHLVYQQALTLAIPALLLGYLVGIGGIAFAIQRLNQLFVKNHVNMQLYFAVDWLPLLSAAIFMMLITLLAAASPAIRASHTTPIAAIRSLSISPKLTRHQLKETRLIEHCHKPILKLALKNYRRNAQKLTMLVMLTTTVAIFISLTSFATNVISNAPSGTNEDLSVTMTNAPEQEIALKQILKQSNNIKKSLIIHKSNIDASLVIAKGPSSGTDLPLVTVDAQRFKRDFNNHPTIINTQIYEEFSGGNRIRAWLFAEKHYQGPVTFTTDLQRSTKHPQKVMLDDVHIVPITQLIGYQLLFPIDGGGALIISTTQYHELFKPLKIPKDSIDLLAGVTLKNRDKHIALTNALKQRFPNAEIYDSISANAESTTIAITMRVIALGFISLLSLISLATIINHTFSALIEQRRGLAMLQSIGTTPGQVTKMLSIQNGLMMFKGWLIGSIIGSAIYYELAKQSQIEPINTLNLPVAQIMMAGIVLILIQLIFAIITHHILTHQNIDVLIRND